MSYSPATSVPTPTELTTFQWSTASNPNPKLAAPVSKTATTLTFTSAPLDHTGAVITTAFIMGIRDSVTGGIEHVYVPAAALSVDGKTATGVTRGIYLQGLDFTTGNSSLTIAHGPDSTVFCDVSGVIQALNFAGLNAQIGANIKFNGRPLFTGSGVASVPVYTNATARDAALLTPSNGDMCYLSTEGYFTDYVGGTWIQRVGSGSTSNASETVAGKIELATTAEINAGTSTGGTGARLVPPNDSYVFMPTGAVIPYTGYTAPNGWLLADGSAVSRSTYANLFGIISPSKGTITMTIASPAVLSLTSHGLQVGDSFYLTTTGALPTGVTANTLYYVISAGYGANSFEFSATLGGAAVNTSGSQSGTHTLHFCPFGLGDGSTTFNVPDLRAKTPFGYKASDTDMGYMGQSAGAKTTNHLHNLSSNGQAQFGVYTVEGGTNVTLRTANTAQYTSTTQAVFSSASVSGNTNTKGIALAGTTDATAPSILNPYVTLSYIIKY